MKVDLFDFRLPKDRIATHPAHPRESARLLHVWADGLRDKRVSDLPSLLRAGDVLVVNDTRVIPARLHVRKGAAMIEVLLHKQTADGAWQVFARPAKKLKHGECVECVRPARAQGSGVCGKDVLTAQVLDKLPSGEVLLRFNLTGEAFWQGLMEYGEAPLPPYIDRPHGATQEDTADYQTCYASYAGSVAAPTAGLHFTPALMAQVRAQGVSIEKVTLHVGAGTFQPVKVEDTAQHIMHAEWGQVNAEVATRINAAKTAGGRVIAVGTTSLRLLESAADDVGIVHPFGHETDIFITPGYRFRVADCLMTNFHLPKSTLFMLVSAFSGLARMHAAYRHAIAAGYRFYSYGDACFLERCDDAQV